MSIFNGYNSNEMPIPFHLVTIGKFIVLFNNFDQITLFCYFAFIIC